MLFSKILLLALPLISSAASISHSITKRDYTLIFNDLKDVDAKTKALTASINACSCTTAQGQAGINAEKALETSIQKLIDDCKAHSGIVTAAQATEFINYVNGQLLTDVTTLVTTLNNSKAKLDAIGLGPVIRAALCRLKTLVLNACACLKSKTPTNQQAAAQSACDKIIAQINKAIAFWGAGC